MTVHLNNHTYTATAGSGVWTTQVQAADVLALADQTHYTVTADVSDRAGNTATQATDDVYVSLTGPGVTINAIATDNRINASEHSGAVVISGNTSGASGQPVTVVLNNVTYNASSTPAVSVSGNAWSLTLTSAIVSGLGDATYSVQASVTDASGNPGSQTQSLLVDTLAPTPPLVINTAASESATTAGNGAVSVTAEAGASVDITFSHAGGGSVVKHITSATGSAQAVTLDAGNLATLGEGSVTASAVVTDAAGNASSARTIGFTIDTLAPATPSVVRAAAAETASMASASAVTVTAESGANVAVTFTNGQHTVVKNVSGNGATPVAVALTAGELTSLTDGTITVSAIATDNAGNASSAGAASFVLDTLAPSTPTVTVAAVSENAAVATASNGAVTVTAEAGASVDVTFTNGVHTLTQTVIGNGSTPVAVVLSAGNLTTLTDGSISVSAVATDAAGNHSAPGTGGFSLDSLLPATPSVSLASDTGTNHTDKITSNGQINVSGVEASATWQYSTNGGTNWSTALSATTTSFTLAEGSYSGVKVRQTDAAGNVGSAYSLGAVTVDTTAPYGVAASFTAAATASLVFTYSENVTASSWSGLTLWKNGSTAMNVTGAVVPGNTTITLATDTTLSNTDYVVAKYDASAGTIQDVAGNGTPSGTLIFGSAASTVLDVSGLNNNNLIYPLNIVSNGVGQTITSAGTGDNILLATNHTRDTLVETSNNSHASFYWSNGIPYANFDKVVNFDVSGSGSTNDVLNLPSATIASATIASATGGWVAGTAVGSVMSYNIGAGGIISFGNAANGTPFMVDKNNLSTVFGFLASNLTASGVTVAFALDTDANGSAESTMVYQSNTDFSPIAVGLYAVSGATLGTTAGANVIQLVDTTAPDMGNMTFASGANASVTLNYTEPVTAANGNGLALYKNGTGSNIATGISADGRTVTTAATLADTDWLLATLDGRSTSVYDTAATPHQLSSQGYGAFGGIGNTTINLSAYGNAVYISGGAGNDTLTGTNYKDTLEGGIGADIMNGGGGVNQFEISQGDSTAVTVGGLSSGSVVNGSTFSFGGAGLADVITGGLTQGSKIHINNALNGFNSPHYQASTSGVAGDQEYFLEQGNYSATSGVFTVSATGTDTLVVYDGDTSSGVSQTGVVLRYITPGMLTESNNNIVASTSAPAIQSVNVLNSSAILVAGNHLQLGVHFDQAVTASVGTQINLTLGTTGHTSTVQATLLSGSGTTDLVFDYQIQSGNNGLFHINTTSLGALSISSGSITATSGGQAANLTAAGIAANLTGMYAFGSLSADLDASSTYFVGTTGNDLIAPVAASSSLTRIGATGTNYKLSSDYTFVIAGNDTNSTPPSVGVTLPTPLGGTTDVRNSNTVSGYGYDVVYVPVVGSTITYSSSTGKVIVDLGIVGSEKDISLSTNLPNGAQALFFQLTDGSGNALVDGSGNAANGSNLLVNLTTTASIDVANSDLFVRGTTGADAINLTAAFAAQVAAAPRVTVSGGAGGDTLTGSGLDILQGDGGINTINGGSGNDTIVIGTGTDTIHGNAGIDTVVLKLASATISSYVDGTDTLHLQSAATSAGPYTDDFLVSANFDPTSGALSSYAIANARNSNSTSTLDGVEQMQLRMNDGTGNRELFDLQAGTSGNDTLYIDTKQGSTMLFAGAGNDTINIGNTAMNVVDGGAGSNTTVLQIGNHSGLISLSHDSNDATLWHVMQGSTDLLDIQVHTSAGVNGYDVQVQSAAAGDNYHDILTNMQTLLLVDSFSSHQTLATLTLATTPVLL